MSPPRRRIEDHSMEEGARKFYATAMAVAVVLVLAAGVVAMVRPFIVGRFAASETVAAGSLDVIYGGQALLIRNERVVIAPVSGTLHLVAVGGDRVGAGEVVAQILDSAGAAKLTKPASSSDTASADAVVEASLREERERSRLSGIRLQLEMKMQERQVYVDRQDAKAVTRLTAEIAQLERDARLAEATVAAAKAEIAEAKRALARGAQSGSLQGGSLAVLRSRQAAFVSYHVDGLEVALDPRDVQVMEVDPGQLTPEPRSLSEGEQVNAGQVVFREITDLYTELVLFANLGDEEVKPGQTIRVRFPRLAQEAVSAKVVDVKLRPDLGEGRQAVRLVLDRFSVSLADLRMEQANMIVRTVYGLLVPAGAVAIRGGVTGVYVLRGNRYVFREVTVVGTVSGRTALTAKGVREGDKVLARP